MLPALVFDTETSGLAGCVLQIGWVLADDAGTENASHQQLWKLPRGERIHSRAITKHGISEAQLAQHGVEASPELLEFHALVHAALALSVCVLAHNVSFDVARLNHTAHKFKLKGCVLKSAQMLCTMHTATKHCELRTRCGKRVKAPSNEELYLKLHGRKPNGRLHTALADCRVTLSSYILGKQKRWW